MAFKVLVFGRDQRIAQHLGKVVVGVDDAPLQRELPDDAVLVIVELRDGGGAVLLEFGDLRKIGGVNQQQARSRAQSRGHHDQQREEGIADKLAPGVRRFRRGFGADGRIFYIALHGRGS